MGMAQLAVVVLAQALAEYSAVSSLLAAAQRETQRLLAFGSDHIVLILAVAGGGLVLWRFVFRPRR